MHCFQSAFTLHIRIDLGGKKHFSGVGGQRCAVEQGPTVVSNQFQVANEMRAKIQLVGQWRVCASHSKSVALSVVKRCFFIQSLSCGSQL
jgi:hypothetical protein